jgi:hypothetical protein
VLGEKLERDFEIVLAAATLDSAAAIGERREAEALPRLSIGERSEAEALPRLSIEALLEAAEGIALTRPGWRVERAGRLGCFALERFALWRDLAARGDAVLAAPVVGHLALATGLGFAQPSPACAAAVTVRPGSGDDLLAPLDADASQLQVVRAAAAGASFVVQGAPGTGKSQTIANLIAHCAAHGKSVLVVSNQLTALDVIHQRLAAVGLGELCLALHAHGPAQIVAQLGRVIERAFRPGSGPTGDGRLTELAAALDGHVAALHRVGPLGRSLHDVLGRLVELRTTPRAALAEPDATGLDAMTFERRRAAVAAVADAAIAVEPVASHPWRASTLEDWPSDGRARALTAIDAAAAAGEALASALRDLAQLVPGILARSREQLEALGVLAAVAARSPRPGGELLAQVATRAARGRPETHELDEQIALLRARGGGTLEAPRDPLTYLELARRHQQLLVELRQWFADPPDAHLDERFDARALWGQLKKWNHSMAPVRFVALRAARAEIRASALPGLEADAEMLAALEAVIAERACRAALDEASERARRWFGEVMASRGIDDAALAGIDAAVAWATELARAFEGIDVAGGDAGRGAAWRALVAQVAASPDLPAAKHDLVAFARLAEAVERWRPALTALSQATGIGIGGIGGIDPRRDHDHLAALRERTDTLRHAIDGLGPWVAFHRARAEALACGAVPAVRALERGDLAAGELALAWERATLLAWAEAELASVGLGGFHGAAHHAHVAAFADLDRAALALVRSRVLVRLAERVPAHPRTHAGASEPGEVDILLEELARLRANRPPRPLRALFGELPALLYRLAPCMLATPLAVARHLDHGLPRFDVVVLDEAAQLPTAEAVIALSRGEAAVIVGDARQLPPSPGASRIAESALEDLIAARLPELRLGWHYRSRHEDVFAFAAEHYYQRSLQLLPAAQPSPDLGISLVRVVGEPGEDGTCEAEAEAIATEVVARLRDPGRRIGARSLAVVVLSRAQQVLVEQRIYDQLGDTGESALAGDESLVVKTVEDIQGDVRDVVLLALGASPDAPVLADELGPRRLAVATTRAREQLVVFAGFGPDDVPVDRAPGLADLAAFLVFAASGGAGRPDRDDAPATPITAAIARALEERGWTVRHRVGCGPYEIDLAVVDPADPERFVIAIEHDGPAYASAACARDRDRLRPQVLAQLGWRLHRVWSLDWWFDPEREIQRAHAAIVTAIAAGRQRRAPMPAERKAPRLARASTASTVAPVEAVPVAGAARDSSSILDAATLPNLALGSSPVRIPRNAIPIGPYTAAAIPPGRRTPDDLFAPRHLAELGKVVEQVLAAEAPMHVHLLARRVGAYFGIGRVTQRVTDQIRCALEGRGKWGDEQDVVWRLDQDPASVPPVRVAGNSPTGRREIDQIPLSELAAAARIVVERAGGVPTTDLIRDAARLMGFARISDPVTARVAQGIRLAQLRELITIENGRAVLPPD